MFILSGPVELFCLDCFMARDTWLGVMFIVGLGSFLIFLSIDLLIGLVEYGTVFINCLLNELAFSVLEMDGLLLNLMDRFGSVRVDLLESCFMVDHRVWVLCLCDHALLHFSCQREDLCLYVSVVMVWFMFGRLGLFGSELLRALRWEIRSRMCSGMMFFIVFMQPLGTKSLSAFRRSLVNSALVTWVFSELGRVCILSSMYLV